MTLNRIDFSPLFRSTIGFDRMTRLLDSAHQLDESALSYPPYNIEKLGDDAYRISIAVAGFGVDDLNIEVKDDTLTVTGKRTEDEKATYLHRGIAGRAFERKFQLADHVRVSDANFENGLLHIDLVREVPEALKPRQIKIGAGAAPQLTTAA